MPNISDDAENIVSRKICSAEKFVLLKNVDEFVFFNSTDLVCFNWSGNLSVRFYPRLFNSIYRQSVFSNFRSKHIRYCIKGSQCLSSSQASNVYFIIFLTFFFLTFSHIIRPLSAFFPRFHTAYVTIEA